MTIKVHTIDGICFGVFANRIVEVNDAGKAFPTSYNVTKAVVAKVLRQLDTGTVFYTSAPYKCYLDTIHTQLASVMRGKKTVSFGCCEFDQRNVAKIRKWAGVPAPRAKKPTQRQRLVNAKAVRA